MPYGIVSLKLVRKLVTPRISDSNLAYETELAWKRANIRENRWKKGKNKTCFPLCLEPLSHNWTLQIGKPINIHFL